MRTVGTAGTQELLLAIIPTQQLSSAGPGEPGGPTANQILQNWQGRRIAGDWSIFTCPSSPSLPTGCTVSFAKVGIPEWASAPTVGVEKSFLGFPCLISGVLWLHRAPDCDHASDLSLSLRDLVLTGCNFVISNHRPMESRIGRDAQALSHHPVPSGVIDGPWCP